MSVVLPWQTRTLANLLAQRDAGRLPHALLLDGPAGWAKRFFARQLARSLVRLPLPEAARAPWGTESADADLLVHRNVRIVGRTPSPTTGRMRQQITVDQVRELGEFLVRTADGARVAIVELAEELNVNAANALLKRLEEPGPDTHLLLVTAQWSRVLPTIRSRCQRLPMPPGSRDEALAWLRDRLPEQDAGAVDRLLRLAGGAPLQALAFAEADVLTLAEQVEAVLDGAAPDDLIGADQRLDPDLARERAGLILELGYRSLATRARALLGTQEARGVQALLDRVVRARRQLASGANPNVTLLLEDLLVGLQGRGATGGTGQGARD